MGDDSGISWTDATYNPTRGCSKVSPGCKHCYAMGAAARHAGPGGPYEGLVHKVGESWQWTGEVRFVESQLDLPLRWQRPRLIFVDSMSDLFHEQITLDQIAMVFAVMALARQHIFQVLTKRPERMRQVLSYPSFYGRVLHYADHTLRAKRPQLGDCPVSDPTRRGGLPNVWLGVSVESADYLERVDVLRTVPAQVRFLSCEPLLGPLVPGLDLSGIGWVIVGGESGHHLSEMRHVERVMRPEWALALRDLCKAEGVPFFFKQHAGMRAGSQPFLPAHSGVAYHEFPYLPAEFGRCAAQGAAR